MISEKTRQKMRRAKFGKSLSEGHRRHISESLKGKIPSACLKAAKLRSAQRNLASADTFVERATLVHGTRYFYSKFSYVTTHTKGTIICAEHGAFSQTPAKHLDGRGCPICRASRGEREVADTLRQLNVSFDCECELPDCRNTRPLPFDFVIWSKEGFPKFIEFQGMQHYTATGWGTERLSVRQHCDALKAAFCRKMNIPLLVIPYWDINRVSELVREFVEEK